MEYEITIESREKNPKYDPKSCPGYMVPEESRYLTTRSLFAVLTEEEFKAVKAAVLEVFK